MCCPEPLTFSTQHNERRSMVVRVEVDRIDAFRPAVRRQRQPQQQQKNVETRRHNAERPFSAANVSSSLRVFSLSMLPSSCVHFVLHFARTMPSAIWLTGSRICAHPSSNQIGWFRDNSSFVSKLSEVSEWSSHKQKNEEEEFEKKR